MAKAAYLFFVLFGTIQLTRMGSTLLLNRIMATFSKPELVRETSKIHTRNYALVPFILARKFVS
jgi:hypothetical protein